MIRSLTFRQLAKEERTLGASLDYVRHILRTSFAAFTKFSLFLPLSRHRRVLPAAPYHVARLVATQDEDSVRERIRGRYGDEGLVELALAIASARVFPITKRALGYATSCARVDVKV